MKAKTWLQRNIGITNLDLWWVLKDSGDSPPLYKWDPPTCGMEWRTQPKQHRTSHPLPAKKNLHKTSLISHCSNSACILKNMEMLWREEVRLPLNYVILEKKKWFHNDSFWHASCVKYAQILLWTHYFIKCASQRMHSRWEISERSLQLSKRPKYSE